MMDFAFPETPEEIQHQEDWVNRTLQPNYPGVRVCLHADRTMTTWRSDADGEIWIRTECDYCPASVITPDGTVPCLAPGYFRD